MAGIVETQGKDIDRVRDMRRSLFAMCFSNWSQLLWKQLSAGSPSSSTTFVRLCVLYLQGRPVTFISSVLAENIVVALQTVGSNTVLSKGVSFRPCMGNVWKLPHSDLQKAHCSTAVLHCRYPIVWSWAELIVDIWANFRSLEEDIVCSHLRGIWCMIFARTQGRKSYSPRRNKI